MSTGPTFPKISLANLARVNMIGFDQEGSPVTSNVRVPAAHFLSLISGATSGLLSFSTVALMNADTTRATGTLAYVYLNGGSTSDPANGYYQWNGSAWVTASWVANFFQAAVQPQVDAAEDAQAAAEAAASAANSGNINIVGEPGELVVNTAGYVLRRTTPTGSVDTGSPARDLATRQALGHAHVARLKAHYAAAPLAPILSRWMHWQLYGQSLSTGSGSIPYYVDAADYAKMANGGVRYLDSDCDLNVSFASIQPMVSQIAETGMFAAIKMYAQAMLEENGVDITATSQVVLGTCIGEGSRSVTELAGSPYFPRVRADFDKAIALTAAAYNTITPAMSFWLQGERDEQLDTVKATYQTSLESLRVAMQVEARGATGNGALILPMLTYQTATHLFYGRATPDIALAQLAEARSNANIAMATPSYFVPFQSATEVHTFSLGYVWLLAHFGLAAKRWQIDGIKPMPLASLSTTRAGRCIRIVYDVEPGRGLRFDTTTIAEQGNKGFAAVDSGGSALTIAAVRIVGANIVEIELSATAPAGCKWRYGWTTVDGVAGRGNLRDNSPIIFDPDNANLPMWKWAAIDEGTAA